MRVLAVFTILIITLAIGTSSASAGCKINLYVKNSGKNELIVLASKVTAARVKGGWWRRLDRGNWDLIEGGRAYRRVLPGQRLGDTYEAAQK